MVKSLLLQEICDKIKIDNILSKTAENHKKQIIYYQRKR